MYPTLADYRHALERFGVEPVDHDVLARRAPSFPKASRTACEQLLASRGMSTTPYRFDKDHAGFVDAASQGAWCAWVEALRFAPNLAKGTPDALRGLFRVYLKTINRKVSLEDLEHGRLDDDTAMRWQFWQQAMAFWNTQPLPAQAN